MRARTHVCVRERRDELYLVDIVYRSFHPHAMVINRVELHLRAEHFVSQRATRNTYGGVIELRKPITKTVALNSKSL